MPRLWRQRGGASVTFLAALAGFALSQLLGWAVRRALSWATDRAERDPYFCREYARPRGGTDSAPAAPSSARDAQLSSGPRVGPFFQGGV